MVKPCECDLNEGMGLFCQVGWARLDGIGGVRWDMAERISQRRYLTDNLMSLMLKLSHNDLIWTIKKPAD
jgi:hypothetical protein